MLQMVLVILLSCLSSGLAGMELHGIPFQPGPMTSSLYWDVTHRTMAVSYQSFGTNVRPILQRSGGPLELLDP
jgi:hypothetical protein